MVPSMLQPLIHDMTEAILQMARNLKGLRSVLQAQARPKVVQGAVARTLKI